MSYTRAVLHRCQGEMFSVFSHRNPIKPITVFIVFMDDDVCRCQIKGLKGPAKSTFLKKGRTLGCVETVITNHGVDVALLREAISHRAGFRKPLGDSRSRISELVNFFWEGTNLIKEAQGVGRPSNIGEFYVFDHLREAPRVVVVVDPLCKRGVGVPDIHRDQITALFFFFSRT